MMKLNKISSVFNISKYTNHNVAIFGAALTAILSMPSYAANAETEAVVDETEIIEVTGIRSSLTSALAAKRDSSNLVEIIQAHDIGKLPDQMCAYLRTARGVLNCLYPPRWEKQLRTPLRLSAFFWGRRRPVKDDFRTVVPCMSIRCNASSKSPGIS